MSSNSGLESIQLKLKRARSHLEEIEKLDNQFRFVDANLELKTDEKRKVCFFVIQLPNPPEMFGTIVGDCLNNQRSVLDYIVWQIVKAGPLSEPSSSNMFPICAEDESFKRQVKQGRLRGVPDRAISIIRDFQPFDKPNHPIWLLKEFCNADKHRDLHYSVTVASDMEIVLSKQGVPFIRNYIGNDELQNGEVFGGVCVDIQFMDKLKDVHAKGRAKAFLSFENKKTESDEPLGVVDCLKRIQEIVEDEILETLYEFLN